jgi:hypothetical protein
MKNRYKNLFKNKTNEKQLTSGRRKINYMKIILLEINKRLKSN